MATGTHDKNPARLVITNNGQYLLSRNGLEKLELRDFRFEMKHSASLPAGAGVIAMWLDFSAVVRREDFKRMPMLLRKYNLMVDEVGRVLDGGSPQHVIFEMYAKCKVVAPSLDIIRGR